MGKSVEYQTLELMTEALEKHERLITDLFHRIEELERPSTFSDSVRLGTLEQRLSRLEIRTSHPAAGRQVRVVRANGARFKIYERDLQHILLRNGDRIEGI